MCIPTLIRTINQGDFGIPPSILCSGVLPSGSPCQEFDVEGLISLSPEFVRREDNELVARHRKES